MPRAKISSISIFYFLKFNLSTIVIKFIYHIYDTNVSNDSTFGETSLHPINPHTFLCVTFWLYGKLNRLENFYAHKVKSVWFSALRNFNFTFYINSIGFLFEAILHGHNAAAACRVFFVIRQSCIIRVAYMLAGRLKLRCIPHFRSAFHRRTAFLLTFAFALRASFLEDILQSVFSCMPVWLRPSWEIIPWIWSNCNSVLLYNTLPCAK